MNTIWKFPLVITDQNEIEMPKGAELLTVQLQHGEPQLWASVDPSAPKVRRRIMVHGTGHQVDVFNVYLATFQIAGGDLIFHVFDSGESMASSDVSALGAPSS